MSTRCTSIIHTYGAVTDPCSCVIFMMSHDLGANHRATVGQVSVLGVESDIFDLIVAAGRRCHLERCADTDSAE
jgi:hypothetical protein